MPHIILAGDAAFESYHKKFEAYKGDSNGWIIKIQNCLLSQTNKTLIFDSTAVRSGFSQDFYIRAELKDGRITVRVDPYMRIEKNEGVQRTIYTIAAQLKNHYPELVLSKTNFPEGLVDLEVLK